MAANSRVKWDNSCNSTQKMSTKGSKCSNPIVTHAAVAALAVAVVVKTAAAVARIADDLMVYSAV